MESLIGKEALNELKKKSVAVIGLGGVGSWCAEALVRSGIGTIYLIDFDEVSQSNVNRQLFASQSSMGMPKAEAAAKRLRDICPDCKLYPMIYKYTPENREVLFSVKLDYIVDAIDIVTSKLDLIEQAKLRHVPIVSALGTGNKKDLTQLSITDVSKTEGCPFARVIRKELRSREIYHHPVIFSPEKSMASVQISDETPPPGRRSIPGSFVWVPATAGFLLCQYVITDLLNSNGFVC